MPVSHARDAVMLVPGEDGARRVPGLLEVLAGVPDPRCRRGRRHGLAFVLAVAAVCVLAGARTFREAGDQAADLPQHVLARLGGTPHPLRRVIIAPSEKRIRTLLQALDAAALDRALGGWMAALAAAGRLEGELRAIAVDGKWLRGVADGQVKLFSAMLCSGGVTVGQVRVPDDTTEVTQVKALLGGVDLDGAVVTADAVHACRETAEYIAGPAADGNRGSHYFLCVKGNQAALQQAAFDAIQASGPRDPDHQEEDRSHGRVTRRSIWVTDADGIDFPHAVRVARIRRDTLDRDGQPLTKEIVHALTSLNGSQATPADLAAIARRHWGIESMHWIRDTAYAEDASTGYAGEGPQVMAALRNTAISLLHLAGARQITRALQAISRNPARALEIIPL